MESKQFLAVNATAITSGATLFAATKGILCTVAGTATLRFAEGDAGVSVGTLTAGVVYPFRIIQFTSGAASLVALY